MPLTNDCVYLVTARNRNSYEFKEQVLKCTRNTEMYNHLILTLLSLHIENNIKQIVEQFYLNLSLCYFLLSVNILFTSFRIFNTRVFTLHWLYFVVIGNYHQKKKRHVECPHVVGFYYVTLFTCTYTLTGHKRVK